MKKPRFTESKIEMILKEVGNGMKVADICRKHGISNVTSCNLKSKYGGAESSEQKHVKAECSLPEILLLDNDPEFLG